MPFDRGPLRVELFPSRPLFVPRPRDDRFRIPRRTSPAATSVFRHKDVTKFAKNVLDLSFENKKNRPMKILFNHVGSGSNTLFVRHLACLLLLVFMFPSLSYGLIKTAETTDLKVTLDTATAALTVTDKNALVNVVWTQNIPPNFHAIASTFVQVTGNEFTVTIQGPTYTYAIDLRIETAVNLLKSFHLTVTPQDPTSGDGYNYVTLPFYPFMFAQSDGGGSWYYVQNNGGEGTLMPLVFPNTAIRGLGSWAAGQPWWGVTNLTQAMMARLDQLWRGQNPGVNSSFGLCVSASDRIFFLTAHGRLCGFSEGLSRLLSSVANSPPGEVGG